MPSVRVSHLEERESKPKRLYATVEGDDGGQRQVTLTIFLNTEAQKRGLPCVENHVYALTPRKRRDFLQGLFLSVLDFSKLPLIDNTVTRVVIRTRIGDESVEEYGQRFFEPVCQLVQSYRGIRLTHVECFVQEDEEVVIPFLPLEKYRSCSPRLQFISIDHILGLDRKENLLHKGVYKVFVGHDQYVYKQVASPHDIPSQANEIDALIRLTISSRVIHLHGLVFTSSPYQTYPEIESPPVVRGILLSYATRGDLHHLLTNDSERISFRQRLLWALEITEGLRDIHNVHLAHSDLKSSNVVIGSDNKANIIDLGQFGVTYGWTAPEVWFAESEGSPLQVLEVKMLQTADVYSLGVVLWELGTRRSVNIPMGMDHREFFLSNMQQLPEKYQELILKCLQTEPGARPQLVSVITVIHSLIEDVEV